MTYVNFSSLDAAYAYSVARWVLPPTDGRCPDLHRLALACWYTSGGNPRRAARGMLRSLDAAGRFATPDGCPWTLDTIAAAMALMPALR